MPPASKLGWRRRWACPQGAFAVVQGRAGKEVGNGRDFATLLSSTDRAAAPAGVSPRRLQRTPSERARVDLTDFMTLLRDEGGHEVSARTWFDSARSAARPYRPPHSRSSRRSRCPPTAVGRSRWSISSRSSMRTAARPSRSTSIKDLWVRAPTHKPTAIVQNAIAMWNGVSTSTMRLTIGAQLGGRLHDCELHRVSTRNSPTVSTRHLRHGRLDHGRAFRRRREVQRSRIRRVGLLHVGSVGGKIRRGPGGHQRLHQHHRRDADGRSSHTRLVTSSASIIRNSTVRRVSRRATTC